MKHSDDHIVITHVGSLPRPKELLDLMRAKAKGESYDPDAYAERVRGAVTDCVQQQVRSGIGVVSDGEQGKLGFSSYVAERLSGFERRPRTGPSHFEAEENAFPEYYRQYFSGAMMGSSIAPPTRMTCVGPVSYRGQEAVRRDLGNLRAALSGAEPDDVFMPSVAPGGVGTNEYYRSEEEYLFAVADAMSTEYRAITEAGFLLQVDDPFLAELYSYSPLSEADKRKRAELHVTAVNHALRGIPEDRVRFHTCYGINEGPRVHDAPLADIAGMMLRVNAGAYSFEAANPRHEHEYHLWETVRLPDGKILMPGVITHASNIIEHPELIAERIIRYAERVGRENVIASADCGFSSQATYHPEIHPTIVWAKFRAMAEGARLATARLWPHAST